VVCRDLVDFFDCFTAKLDAMNLLGDVMVIVFSAFPCCYDIVESRWSFIGALLTS